METITKQALLLLGLVVCLFSRQAFCYQVIDRTFEFDVQNSNIVCVNNGKSLYLNGNVDLFSINVNDVINTYIHFADPIVLKDLHTGFFSGWGKNGLEPISFSYKYYNGGTGNCSYKYSIELDVIGGQADWSLISNQSQSSGGSGFNAASTYVSLTDSFAVIQGMSLWTRITSTSSIKYIDRYELQIFASDISVGWVPEPASLLLLGLGSLLIRKR
jgi:hypothetical protein